MEDEQLTVKVKVNVKENGKVKGKRRGRWGDGRRVYAPGGRG